MLKKVKTARKILRDEGLLKLLYIIERDYKIYIPRRLKSEWKNSIDDAYNFWDKYFETKGLIWTKHYGNRFNPELPLQCRPTSLLPNKDNILILDVGAGPLTYLGKVCEGKNITIKAVDALADGFNEILKKHKIEPIVKTEKLDAERLSDSFAENTFDLVFARNCIDHTYNAILAIKQMLRVVKRGCYILLEHHPNEATKENHSGMHHWDFTTNSKNEFIIKKRFTKVNISKKFEKQCIINCELISGDEEWLITQIKKL